MGTSTNRRLSKTKQKKKSTSVNKTLKKADERNIRARKIFGNTNWIGFLALLGIILADVFSRIYFYSYIPTAPIEIPVIVRILFIIFCITVAWQLGMRRSAGSKFLPILAIIIGLLSVFFLMYQT